MDPKRLVVLTSTGAPQRARSSRLVHWRNVELLDGTV